MTKKSPQGPKNTNATDLKCMKLKRGLNEMKIDLGKECDDILNKIDEILQTELTTFDKI